MAGQENQNMASDEITLKELILKGREYFFELLRNWLLILLIAVPVVGYLLYQHYSTPVTFPAQYTFMVNEEEGNSVSSIGSILGQIGIGGGGARRSRYNLDKILSLAQTKKIIGRALFDTCDVQGEQDLLANHLIAVYELDKEWAKKDESMLNFRFTRTNIENFDIKENKAFKKLHTVLVGSAKSDVPGLISNSYAEETGVMTLQAATLDPHLTICILKLLYQHLGDYYVENSTEKQRKTYELVMQKKDSIEQAVKAAEFALANFKETSRNLIDRRSQLQELRLNREVIIGTTALGEAVRNTEISDFALRNVTPFIQPVDEPFLPLGPERPSLLKNLVKAIVLGIFLGAFFVVVRKMYRDAMA